MTPPCLNVYCAIRAVSWAPYCRSVKQTTGTLAGGRQLDKSFILLQKDKIGISQELKTKPPERPGYFHRKGVQPSNALLPQNWIAEESIQSTTFIGKRFCGRKDDEVLKSTVLSRNIMSILFPQCNIMFILSYLTHRSRERRYGHLPRTYDRVIKTVEGLFNIRPLQEKSSLDSKKPTPFATWDALHWSPAYSWLSIPFDDILVSIHDWSPANLSIFWSLRRPIFERLTEDYCIEPWCSRLHDDVTARKLHDTTVLPFHQTHGSKPMVYGSPTDCPWFSLITQQNNKCRRNPGTATLEPYAANLSSIRYTQKYASLFYLALTFRSQSALIQRESQLNNGHC